ncbi:MAG: glutaredoxin family protein [Thermodesulfobacteriota bacterium]
MTMIHVEGKKMGRILLYALSTCVWCRKTKQLLDQLGVDYNFVDVDLLSGAERAQVMEEIKKLNPRCSFPTLTIDDQCIIGFDEQKIKGALKS